MNKINTKLEETKEETKVVELTELVEGHEKGSKFLEGNFSIISGVKVKLDVMVGETELTVDELFNLQKDSVIPLKQALDAPLTVRLDGKVVALGTLVVVGDNFGIQISEISDTNALKSL